MFPADRAGSITPSLASVPAGPQQIILFADIDHDDEQPQSRSPSPINIDDALIAAEYEEDMQRLKIAIANQVRCAQEVQEAGVRLLHLGKSLVDNATALEVEMERLAKMQSRWQRK